MTDKTATQVANMKKQTIGVEVEMNGISREKAAKIAADFFKNLRLFSRFWLNRKHLISQKFSCALPYWGL